MKAIAAAVLLLLLAAAAVADPDRVRRQARGTKSCKDGQACTLLAECPELQKLLQPSTVVNIWRLRKFMCGYRARNVLVCCPSPTARASPRLATPPPPRDNSHLLPRYCGHTFSGQRIFGGIRAPLGAYPWMAVLGFSDGRWRTTPIWSCGGSVISSRYVLTAAHCTVPAMTNYMNLATVRLGENHLLNDPDCGYDGCAPSPVDFGIEAVIRHPSFHSKGAYNDDVALLRLDNTITFTPFIQPICLPDPGKKIEDIISSRDVIVIGFGETEAGVRSNQLLQVVAPYVPMEQCRKVGNYNKTLAPTGQVCFGGQFQRDSCFKDSGGPAQVQAKRNGPPYVQVGIVSHGTTFCGVENVPAIYTDVSHYRSWIISQLSP